MKKKKQYEYKIVINKEPGNIKNKYKYHYYSSTIEISISKECGVIHFTRTTKNKLEDFTKGRFFTESVKRFVFVYLVNYNSFIDIKKCHITINDKMGTVAYYYNPVFDINPSSKIPESLASQSVIEPILANYSASNTKLSSINNFILAINSEYSVERFMHLWMAFNGLYEYLSSTIKTQCSIKRRTGENDALNWWGICNNLETLQIFKTNISKKIHQKNSNEIKAILCSFLKKNSISTISQLEQSYINIQLIEKLKKLYKLTDLKSCFGFLLLKCAYFTRCDVFHGSKKLMLFSDLKNGRYVFIDFLSNLLIDYLSQVYQFIFDEEYIQKMIAKHSTLLT